MPIPKTRDESEKVSSYVVVQEPNLQATENKFKYGRSDFQFGEKRITIGKERATITVGKIQPKISKRIVLINMIFLATT